MLKSLERKCLYIMSLPAASLKQLRCLYLVTLVSELYTYLIVQYVQYHSRVQTQLNKEIVAQNCTFTSCILFWDLGKEVSIYYGVSSTSGLVSRPWLLPLAGWSGDPSPKACFDELSHECFN